MKAKRMAFSKCRLDGALASLANVGPKEAARDWFEHNIRTLLQFLEKEKIDVGEGDFYFYAAWTRERDREPFIERGEF